MSWHRAASLLAWLGLLCACSPAVASPPAAAPQSEDFSARLSSPDARAYGSLPLVFEPNRGQSDAPVRYLARGAGYRMLFTAQSALITSRAGEESTATIGIRYLGANSRPRVVGEAGLPGASNYFRGRNESAYLTDVPHYAKVR